LTTYVMMFQHNLLYYDEKYYRFNVQVNDAEDYIQRLMPKQRNV